MRSRRFRHASGTTRPSDSSTGVPSHFALAYRVGCRGATRGPAEVSQGHALVFRTVPSANTLVRWVDESAFASIVQARPCPTFGRPVRHGVAPSTTARYCSANPSDPTSRWAPCPPQFRRGGSRSTLAVSGFRLRARLGVSTPATCGRRGITPAFGYGPPHPGAGGTSTLLTSALPGAHYAVLRLPAAHPVSLRCLRSTVPKSAPASLPRRAEPARRGLGLVTRCPSGFTSEASGPPRFLDVPVAHMLRSWTPVESQRPGLLGPAMRPSAVVTASASTATNSRGSLTQPARSMCTLRSAGLPVTPRNTRFRLVANLYRAGFETRRDALRVSAHRGAHHPPSPGLAWRNTTFRYTSVVHPPWVVGVDVRPSLALNHS